MHSYKLFTYAPYENLLARALREKKTDITNDKQYKKTLKKGLQLLQSEINSGNEKAIDFRNEMFNYFVDKKLKYSDKQDEEKEKAFTDCYFSYKNLPTLPTECMLKFIQHKKLKENSLPTIVEEDDDDRRFLLLRRLR